MKKTIFVGISLLSISICIDEVWGDLPRRYNTSNIGRRTSWQGSTVSNSQNRRNNIGNMNVQAMTNVGPESVKSFLAGILIERSASDDLKKIVDEVPSEDIRVLQRNMENFNIFLKGSGDEDAKNVANKLERAIACLGELITVKDVICSELQYQTKENKGSSNGMVSLSSINDDLNEVNMKRLSEIILICEKERTFAAFTGALKKFSNRINNLKNILKEMSDTFNPVVLGQIEGNPGLQNLESANTPENRRLGKIRDDEEEKNDSFDSQIVSAQQNTGQQSGTENNTNNATNSQPTPAQQSVGQSATESIPADAAVVQVASTPQNTIQTTDVSNSDATTTPGVSGQPQNTTQTETGNSSNNATSQGALTQQQSVGQTGTENNTNNATNSQSTPAQQGVGQSATESIPANAAVAQVTSTPQNTIQTTDVSNSNATTTPGVSGQPQNTSQIETGNSSNIATSQGALTQQQSVGQPGMESNAGNGTNSQPAPAQTGQQPVTEGNLGNAVSQPTPAQQGVGQSATESIPANAAVAQVTSTPQNTIQTTDVSNSNATTTPGVSGQPQNTGQTETGNSSNNATSQGALTQQQSVGQPGMESNAGNGTNSQPAPAQTGQQPVTEGNLGNAVSQPTPAQQGVGQPVTENNTSNVSAQADPVQSEQSQNTESIQILPGKLVEEPEDIGKSSFENGSGYDSGYESENNTTTASNSLVNTINREDPKEFYALLEQNVGLLKEEDLEGKKKIAYDKVRGYLENAKSERSFAERVTDVKNIIDAYNSLATLIPRTKKWERLRTVPRQKIKSLRETIYSDVFDDLKSRMEKLKADDELKNYGKDIDSFIKLNERNKSDFFDNSFFNEFLKYIENNKKELNFADFLRTKGKNTESFEVITSDRKNKVGRSDQFSNALIYDDKKASFVIGIYRRGLMSASMDSYDKLIMKFWKETKVDRKVVDLVGPDLRNRVLFSIDVN